MLKTRLVPLPLTDRRPVVGPLMVRFLLTTSSPLVNVIVAGVATEKLIVSPGLASAIAWRNEPAPLSLVLVTVMVAARPFCAIVMAAQSSVIRIKVSRVFIGGFGYWLC